VFGVLKAIAKREFRVRFMNETKCAVGKKIASELLRQCWDEVSVGAIARGWCIYQPEAAE
jgi:hypothetical protein